MKKASLLLIILFTTISSFAQIAGDSIPASKGPVNDFEQIYTKAEVKTLDSLISTFKKKTGYEIAIITVDVSLTADSSFDEYIKAVGNAWGVVKEGKNKGIMIGISSQFGSIIIVNGDGVTAYLSDDATKLIIDTIFIPNFTAGNYYKGTKEGLLEIMGKLK